jgi:hypothetical protein
MIMLQNVRRSLGTILTNIDEVHDESRRRANSGNVCYYSVLILNIPSASQNKRMPPVVPICMRSGGT